MDTTEEELLTKIHKVTLYILLAFDKVCRENDLTYFLDSGSALGAVRHGGFIPWDDDIDVGMPRKDYERFLQIGQEKLPKEFFIQTRETDPNYRRFAAKLRLRGTVFPEQDTLPYKENGFFIDIFPFDNVPRNKYLAKCNLYIARCMFHIIRSWHSEKQSPSFLRRFLVNTFVKKMTKSQIDRMGEHYLIFCRKYENKETGFCTCYSWGMSQYNTYIFDVNKLLPINDISFEGHYVKIMNDPDYYLRLMYGDYMVLPPEDKRHIQHLEGVIDFGKYTI